MAHTAVVLVIPDFLNKEDQEAFDEFWKDYVSEGWEWNEGMRLSALHAWKAAMKYQKEKMDVSN